MFRTIKEQMYLIEKQQYLYIDTTILVKLIDTLEKQVKYIDLFVLKKIQNIPLLNKQTYFLS